MSTTMTFKYKLQPFKRNKDLQFILNVCCEIWNYCVLYHRNYYNEHKKLIHRYELCNHLVLCKKIPEYLHWNLVNSQTITRIAFRVDAAYKVFFAKVKKKDPKVRIPDIKNPVDYSSFTMTYDNGCRIVDKNTVEIMKKQYRFFNSLPTLFWGKEIDILSIKTLTVKKSPLGEYFIYFTCNVNLNVERKTIQDGVGCDFGLKTFLTTSCPDLRSIDAPQYFKDALKKFKSLNTKIRKRRDQKLSCNKASKKLAKLYEKVRNKRKDFHLKIARMLATTFDLISFESLNLHEMKSKWKWGRKISDYGFSSFLNITEWICKKLGSIFVQIGNRFPSTKLCNVCHYKNDKLTLNDRTWECPNCQSILDRDFNAANNILVEGFHLAMSM